MNNKNSNKTLVAGCISATAVIVAAIIGLGRPFAERLANIYFPSSTPNIVFPTPTIDIRIGNIFTTSIPVGETPISSKTQSSFITSEGNCPSTAEIAASIFGGSSTYWKRLDGYENFAWKYGPAPTAPIENIYIPEGMKGDWWDNYTTQSKSGPTGGGYATEATIWCTP